MNNQTLQSTYKSETDNMNILCKEFKVESLKEWRAPKKLLNSKFAVDRNVTESLVDLKQNDGDIKYSTKHMLIESYVDKVVSETIIKTISENVNNKEKIPNAQKAKAPVEKVQVEKVQVEKVQVEKNRTGEVIKEKQLEVFFRETNEKKLTDIKRQFLQALRFNPALGWITDLKYQAIQITTTKTQEPPASLKIYLGANTSTKSKWLCLNEWADHEKLTVLLKSGWPKQLKIEIEFNLEFAEVKSNASIVFQIAYLIGTHFAPYSPLIEKALVRGKLSNQEGELLQHLLTRKSQKYFVQQALHVGHLTAYSADKTLANSEFRDVLDSLCKTQFKGADKQYLCRKYSKLVSVYHPLTGMELKSSARVNRQFQFYQAYADFQDKRRKTFPYLEKFNARRETITLLTLGAIVITSLFLSKEYLLEHARRLLNWTF